MRKKSGKKYGIIPWLLAVCLCLAGCSQSASAPAQAADGTAWDPAWVSIGNAVGVDTPRGMTLLESNNTLSSQGMYYAAWSMGEAEPYPGEDGEDIQIYDAQVYFLLAGYDQAGKSEDAVSEMLDMAYEQYVVEEAVQETCGGQAFTVVTYTYKSGTNPYARGASAFGVFRNYAVSVELSCQDSLDGSAKEILVDFLEHCHYAAED